jgi:hypothetical protein
LISLPPQKKKKTTKQQTPITCKHGKANKLSVLAPRLKRWKQAIPTWSSLCGKQQNKKPLFPFSLSFFLKKRVHFTLCSVRPETEREKRNFKTIVRVLDEHVIVFDPAGDSESGAGNPRRGGHVPGQTKRSKDFKYAFDRVFDMDSTQEEVYEQTAKPLIQSVLNGFNATVFAYGATGAGTYLLTLFFSLFVCF